MNETVEKIIVNDIKIKFHIELIMILFVIEYNLNCKLIVV